MRLSFERTGNGVLAIRRRAMVVDSLLEPLWRFESGGEIPTGLALVAVGGFGRKELFPSSDVDLLYLCSDTKTEEALRETVRRHSRAQNVRQLRLFDGSAASGEGDGKPVSEMFAAVERYRR